LNALRLVLFIVFSVIIYLVALCYTALQVIQSKFQSQHVWQIRMIINT